MAVDVNGNYFDWGSIQIDLDGVKYDNEFDSLSYGETSNFTTLPGRGPRPKGRTRGKLEYDGTLKMSREVWGDIVRQLGGSGWRTKIINIAVNYGDDAANAQCDKLKKVKLHSPKNDHSNGEEALMVEVSLSILDIVYDGEDENVRL